MATGTQIEVVMPQMGVSVSEGTITKWLKQPGEAIAQDEPLLEISTDKVDTEVPSPGEGVVAEILVAEGETVEVGTRARGDRACAALLSWSPSQPASPGAARARCAAPPAPSDEAPAAAPNPRSRRRGRSRSVRRCSAGDAAGGNGRTFVSPVVARIAAEHGVDPTAVPGTGTGGRVTKKDILAYIESGGAGTPPRPAAAAPAAAPAPAAGSGRAGTGRTRRAGRARRSPPAAARPPPATAPGGRGRRSR